MDGTNLEYSSMLKKTYSPLETIFNPSAANIISRIVVEFAHKITTVKGIQLHDIAC